MAEKKTRQRSAAVKEQYFNAAVSLVTTLLFFGTLIALGCVTAFSEKEAFSETQNKYLAKFPELSFKKIYNGSFAQGTEDYLSDHFAGHDGWISLKTETELLSGKRESNDVYILADRLVEKIPAPDEKVTDKSVDAIKLFAAENDVSPYIMLVPTQAEIYKDELPANAPNPDQQEFISDIYARLEGSAVPIDVYSVLSANRNDYIYYRTDHHWTTKGAFIAYTAACKKMGFTPLTEDRYDIDHASSSFRGTFYSKTLYGGIAPDTVDIWLPSENAKQPSLEIYSSFGEEPVIHEGLYFREFLGVKDKYSAFLGTNQPMADIRTGNGGESLLIFKDSYAHCLVPFLTEHFSRITLVDMRYIQTSYSDVIDVSDYDRVMFLYNASTFMSDENIKKLMY